MTADLQDPVESPLNPLPVAVVVGASSGIGAALARKYTREGYKVVLLARREAQLEALCEEINQAAGERRATAYPHDVTSYQEIPALFQKILLDLQHIDVFIYSSGVDLAVGRSEYNFEKDKHTVEVNLLGAMAWLDQAAVLFDRMGGGHLVGISSVAGDRGRVMNPPLHASKAGLSTYLESLRNRLSRKGVHVLTVKPGYVDTEMIAGRETPFPAIPPEEVADEVFRAVRGGKQVLYTPGWWRLILLVVRHIPSFIFRRMSF